MLVSEAEGFPGGTVVKNLSADAGDTRDEAMIPGSGRSSGVGNGNPFQYSCLGNPLDEEPGYSPWGRKESDTTEHACTHKAHTEHNRSNQTGYLNYSTLVI